jgi:hypothetical protein
MASLVLLLPRVSLNESNHILHFQKTYLTDIAIQISTIKFVLKSVFNKNANNVGCSFGKVWANCFIAAIEAQCR